jgi:hypothetical protein
MAKTKPDHQDAELVLRVYENAARGGAAPGARDAAHAVLAEERAGRRRDHERRPPAERRLPPGRHVLEMVYGLVRHDVVHAGFFLDSNLEGLFLFAKVEAYVDEMRKATTPLAFRNAEWVAKECPEGKQLFDVLRVRVKKLFEARG